jgi:hypothetical protein
MTDQAHRAKSMSQVPAEAGPVISKQGDVGCTDVDAWADDKL